MTSRPSTNGSNTSAADGGKGKTPDRLPLLPKTIQDLPPNSSTEETPTADLYGFSYVNNNLSTPVSPKQLSETDHVGDGLIPGPAHDESTPLLSASTLPAPRSGLHSFPPAFGQSGSQSQDHQDPNASHNFWDLLCHCIESLTNAGTLGVVGAVIVLIVFITTCSSIIPGVPWAGNGNTGGIAGSIQGFEDRFAQALQKSASANLTRIALGGVSDSQITVYVGAQVSFDYTRAEDATAAWLLRAAGGTLGSISVAESAAQVYVKQEEDNNEEDNDPYKLAFVAHAPPIDQFYLQEGIITNLSMGINLTSFDRPGLLTDIAKRLLLGDPIPVRLTTVITLHKWFIPFGSYPVTIEAIINEKKNSAFKDLDKMKLAELEIQNPPGAKSLDFAARLRADFKPPISAHVPQINWDLAIPGCNYPERQHDVVTITSVHNLPVDVSPRRALELKVAAAIKAISDKISEICPGTGHSVLDKLLQGYLAGESTHLVVKGSCDQSAALPWWMAEVLQFVQVPIPIPKKGDDGDNTKLVEEIAFSSMKIQFPPPRSPFDREPARPTVPPKISGHVAVTIDPPKILNLTEDIGLGVDKIRGQANLISTETGVLFAKLNISEWVASTTWAKKSDPRRIPEDIGGGRKEGEEGEDEENDLIEYVIEFDLTAVPLTVVDEKTLSGIATQFVMRGEAAVTFDAVVDVHLTTPVGAFGLNQIPVHGDTIMRT
ncbi:uncharacterized protein SAPINGB_P002687 [Magnusiomyces paraingens]|uniref:Tag1 C-terminal domain-containing protein n=1 Tax=Magnusiomyces paraingens TaxID=2606893 RepID=A0A5E8BNE6_9ASCO|nr:uncharacterized protein SAPINGB_P002687 [Saprochaete ingens]VVT50273.1 unnamed protein product [Saprochaete ingens]